MHSGPVLTSNKDQLMLKSLFAAALVLVAGATSITVAAPAEAQTRTVVTERTVVRSDAPRYRETRRYNQRRVTRRTYNNGRRYATRRVCTNRYRDGRRIRTCRTVRRR